MLQRSYQCPLFTWPFLANGVCLPLPSCDTLVCLHVAVRSLFSIMYVARVRALQLPVQLPPMAAPLMTVQQHLGKTKSERWRFRREWYASFWGMLLAPRLLVHQAPSFQASLIYALFMYDERTRTLAHRSTGCVGKVLNHIMTHIHHTVQKRLIACAPPYQSVVGGGE